MFTPTLKQTIDGHIGNIEVRIRVEVSAGAADALADDRNERPTLAAVQNTMVLLVRPLYQTLGIMEGGGTDALVGNGPTAPQPHVPYTQTGKILVGDFAKTAKDTEDGKGD